MEIVHFNECPLWEMEELFAEGTSKRRLQNGVFDTLLFRGNVPPRRTSQGDFAASFPGRLFKMEIVHFNKCPLWEMESLFAEGASKTIAKCSFRFLKASDSQFT
ncbi:hypothetical protein CEXT_619211 [Caerostris extrusa]|uniref:Uncharacterized protein n=1 Tax=Caerostris extrusa TaxID=172846 RepID=A0AAV4SAW3_CAEEX|nr:hypothetical protein CEXT_619211 [Caerostris extrusa]